MAPSATSETNSYGPTTISDSATAVLGNHYGDLLQVILVRDEYSATLLSGIPAQPKHETSWDGPSSGHRCQAQARHVNSNRTHRDLPRVTGSTLLTSGTQKLLNNPSVVRAASPSVHHSLTRSLQRLLEDSLKGARGVTHQPSRLSEQKRVITDVAIRECLPRKSSVRELFTPTTQILWIPRSFCFHVTNPSNNILSKHIGGGCVSCHHTCQGRPHHALHHPPHDWLADELLNTPIVETVPCSKHR